MSTQPNKNLLISLIVLCFIDLLAIGDKPYQTDKRIVLQEGLSQSRILSVLEDERGFMWFGTADGLNRYDGYSTKIFRNILNDSTTLPNNQINSMVEDNNGNLWIGTNNGVANFNPYTETSLSFPENDSVAIALGANIITACAIDNNNNIWCGTGGHGIFKIDRNTLEKEYFLYSACDSLYLNMIASLYVDSENRLWIGGYMDNGIFAFDINSGKLTRYPVVGNVDKNKKSQKVYAFYEDNQKRIWTGIVDYVNEDGSLFYLDKRQNTFKNYNQMMTKEFCNLFSDTFNSIISITGDQKGNIWVASLLSGVLKYTYGSTPTAYYVESPMTDARINCIYRSRNGILWLGTNGNGVEISIADNTDFKLMSTHVNSDFSIASIRAFAEDKNYYWVAGYSGVDKIKKDFSKIEICYKASIYSLANNFTNSNLMWTGSEGGGLKLLNKNDCFMSEAFYGLDAHEKEINGNIFSIFPVNDSLVLLGTNDGLVGFNPVLKTNILYPFFNPGSTASTIKTVRTIVRDNHGNILIGYVNGNIGRLLLEMSYVEKFNLIPDMRVLNTANPVNCIYSDNKNRYWLATSNGLIVCNTHNNSFKLFSEADGLPNSHIYGILPDEDDNLWMSTNNGLSCFNTIENTFRNYDVSDGLQNNEFNTGAYFKATDGTLFFGGISGFNYFHPKKIKQNSIVPQIEITGIKIEDKYLKINKQDFVQHQLTIHPHEEVFTIEFAGLSFINCDKNQYKYKIKELNQNWINLGKQHQITFNNLSPGSYTLQILAANNHGLWLKSPYTFSIVVLPTFFESIYFKWLIVIFIALMIFFGIKLRLYQLTRQKDKLQIYANQQTASLLAANETLKEEIVKHQTTANELEASNKTKDKFLSIIAHDLMGPLGVIQGFSDLLCDKGDVYCEAEKETFTHTINKATKELILLLSNLLQWSRLQNKVIHVNPNTLLIKDIIEETTMLLQGNILEKEIDFQIMVDDKTWVIADKNMLATVFRNLISNAIKFTPNKGHIHITSETIGNMEQITIADNGVGIPEENIKRLFNPELALSTKGTNNESGTGLGLGLVHEFVILNNGKIWVTSQVDQGTRFIFTLPKSN